MPSFLCLKGKVPLQQTVKIEGLEEETTEVFLSNHWSYFKRIPWRDWWFFRLFDFCLDSFRSRCLSWLHDAQEHFCEKLMDWISGTENRRFKHFDTAALASKSRESGFYCVSSINYAAAMKRRASSTAMANSKLCLSRSWNYLFEIDGPLHSLEASSQNLAKLALKSQSSPLALQFLVQQRHFMSSIEQVPVVPLSELSLHGWAQNGVTTNYRITWKVPNLL